jgi:DNA topoisomerase-1
MKLIIVESPTKSKTLEKFLGKEYKIEATLGHVRDLPEKTIGVDIEKDFNPKYIVSPRRKKTIKELKDASKKAEEIYLAMDPDREGEAIAWHVAKIVKLKKPKRIVFHEITEQAIKKALNNPKDIDSNLVDAQQARRILDRVVGYKLSPFLWKKIAAGLSAGRVQSVAVRLVADREKEIKNFKPEEYWTIEAFLRKLKNEHGFRSLLIKINEEKIEKLQIKSAKEAKKIVDELESAEYKIIGIEKKETKKNPLPPFTTSTMQRSAFNKLRFPAKLTMRIAQHLYEKGLITYHRTDSLSLSKLSLNTAQKFIIKNYGKNYWAGKQRIFKTKKRAQEAHEAIRPTFPDNTPEETQAKKKLETSEAKLYDLIWRRFIASQMKEALFDSVRADIKAKKYTFRANGHALKFDGFLKVYPVKFEEIELPELEEREVLELKELKPSQHFTQPPPRYNDASLIKILEEHGVGRPSTYAPIIGTIQNRNYVDKDDNKRFKPTDIGLAVNDLLSKNFEDIVDIDFTAEMEEDLDKVASGEKQWVSLLKDFYGPFEKNLKKKEKEIPHKKMTYEKTDRDCPECGNDIVIKLGRYGKFYACTNYPKCKHTEPLEKNTLHMKCPKCKKGQITEKRTKKGKVFYGCTNWPNCDAAAWYKPTGKLCPNCNSLIIETKRKQIKCSSKDCDYVEKKIDE